jgi:hypothetical protein
VTEYLRHCSKKELLAYYLLACTAYLLLSVAYQAWRGKLKPFIRNHDRLHLFIAAVSFYGIPIVGFHLFMERLLSAKSDGPPRLR